MQNRTLVESLRYKDRGKVTYRIIEGFDMEQDCLELIYSDNEKKYVWDYYFDEDGKTMLEHIQSVSYETLRKGFIDNIKHDGYYMDKGEYQLMKESVMIFVSHKKYILDLCTLNGFC